MVELWKRATLSKSGQSAPGFGFINLKNCFNPVDCTVVEESVIIIVNSNILNVCKNIILKMFKRSDSGNCI